MQDQSIDQQQIAPYSINNRKMSQFRLNTTKRSFKRTQKLKDKSLIFPQSTLNKIVFISNIEGNAFKRENLSTYDLPTQINLPSMIDEINSECFKQWRESLLAKEQQALVKYDTFQSIVAVCVFVISAALVGLIFLGQHEYILVFGYTFIVLVFVCCLCSLLLMREKRVDINRDANMIKTIKTKLIELNKLEEQKNPQHLRYLWTCHKECLWIAIQLK